MSRLKSSLSLLLFAASAFASSSCTAVQQTANGNAATNSANANGNAPRPLMLGAGAPPATPCPPYPAPTPPMVDDKPNPCIPYSPSFAPGVFGGNGEIGMGAATAQPSFDVFSWRSFVALNWPADGSVIGQNGDAPTVWETYNESYQVFLDDGSQPHWGPPVNVPAACQNAGANLPVFRMIAKVSQQVAAFNQSHGGTVLDERGQPFKTGPLVDPHGQYVRFEISLNKETFDYIVANKLYNREGQAAFNNDAGFPAGDNGNPNANPPTKPTLGSVVIKTAWRVLDPAQGDHPERYHTIKALVYNAPSDDPPVQAQCSVQTLGLVGFHVMHKTSTAPQWIWSTFEQVDNVRADAKANVPATFFDPKHPERKINQPPDKPWDPSKPATPSQLVRINPIDKPTQDLNAGWQKMLSNVNPKSVWQFYQLVSTQWPTSAKSGGFGKPAPPVLANLTLETYTQRSSSCIACHNNATQTTGKFGDFSYLLQRAQPEKK
ncbi:MAG: hypothetical protein ABR563_15525 [Pyrinomonadaceae bacterium]